MRAYLGTNNGVYVLDSSSLSPLGLAGNRVWAIHAWTLGPGQDIVLAGSYGSGMFRSSDGGGTWSTANDGLSASYFRTIEPGPPGTTAMFAGTEPARAFRSDDLGRSWSEFDAIPAIDSCSDWFLPYSPRAGALRNFAWTPDAEIYAAVEVGGLLHSPDAGETWRLIPVDPGPRVHDDIHFVIVDPAMESRIFVALGGALVDRTHGEWMGSPRRIGGVAVSEDRGATWSKLLPDYTRAILIPSTDDDWLIAAPAERTGHGGWIVGSRDRGASWTRIDREIETPMDDMVERFEEAPDGTVWAICSGGRLFVAEPGEWLWSNPLPPGVDDLIVEAVSFVES